MLFVFCHQKNEKARFLKNIFSFLKRLIIQQSESSESDNLLSPKRRKENSFCFTKKIVQHRIIHKSMTNEDCETESVLLNAGISMPNKPRCMATNLKKHFTS